MRTINELTLGELEERERAAYAAGDTERADLYAAVIELRQEVEALEDAIADASIHNALTD